MNCPNCGKELNENINFCPDCGTKVNETECESEINHVKNDYQFPRSAVISTAVFFIIAVVVVFLILNSKSDSLNINTPTSNENEAETTSRFNNHFNLNKAKNCEHEDVKNLAINIYKQNDYYYKYIDETSIDSIFLRSPVATSYDSNIDKYSCKGVIVLQSKRGFKPIEYGYGNKFYSLAGYNYTSDNVPAIKKAIEIRCPITYTSQISEGSTTVYSSYCGDGTIFDYNTKEEFIWDEYEKYIEIPGAREKIRQEKREKEQKIEQQKQTEKNVVDALF